MTIARTARLGVVALLTLVVGYFAFADALTNVVHRRNGALALRFSPGDPTALTTLAGARLVELRGRAINDAQVRSLARRSIVGNPMNPLALRLLGLTGSVRPTPATLRQMNLAERLTRRDLLIELWLIEAAVARDNVPAVLSHYDHALRTAEEARPILFPVLTAALENRELWEPFQPYLREPAPWMPAFLRHAVRETRQPGVYADLIHRSGGLPRGTVSSAIEAELIKRLVEAGDLPRAVRLYATLPGSNRSVPGSVAFTETAIDPRFAPLTWEIYANPGVTASFLRGDDGQLQLQVAMEALPATAVARKVVQAQPGRYRFTARQWLGSDVAGAQVTWELLCTNGAQARPVWSQSFPLSTRPTAARGEVMMPSGCDATILRVLTQAAESGTQIVLGSVALEPA